MIVVISEAIDSKISNLYEICNNTQIRWTGQ